MKSVRPYVSSLLAVWLAQLLVATLIASPLLDAARQSFDRDFFEPGGVMLLEVLRIHRNEILSAIKWGGLALLSGQSLIVYSRFRLLSSVFRENSTERASGSSLIGAAFFFLTILQFATLLILGFTLLYFTRSIVREAGATFPTTGLLPLLLTWTLGSALYLMVCVLADLAKLSIFSPLAPGSFLETLKTRAHRLFSLFSCDFFTLTSLRAARGLVTLVLTFTIIRVHTQGADTTPLFDILAFVATQGSALVVLAIEALWLDYLAKKLIN